MYAARGYMQGPLGSAQSLASATNIAKFIAPEKMDVLELNFEVTTLTSSSGSIVITVYDRTSPGVSSGQVVIGTLTIPTGVAVGTIYYKLVEYTVIQGHSVEFDVTTAATSAGAGYSSFKVGFSSDDNRNVSSMVLSA